ncbi:MAG TPA: tRNA (adenosine(37)-N6)-dimethylallyltransferase MiaA [Chthoniobacterales bacterium]|nr:tRNA (adenosine(37)-N6)-dimethylallyltransferase MiaA [Chthoniobacterales bacterium]
MQGLRYMVLAGATGVGKTDVAIRIAQDVRTEIVGADAFQIYQGLDILSCKPTPSQLLAAPHHLISKLPLTEPCDAQKYAVIARATIARLNQNGIVPLVVGGTGFYLRALESSLPELPPADFSLRTELDQRSTSDLLRELDARDALASKRIDRHNRRRIIRALEVCILSGKPFSSFLEESAPDPSIPRLFLELPRTVLFEKINLRVDQMFEQGVVAEVAAIEAIGPTASQAIGFKLIRSLIVGTIDAHRCRETIQQQTRNYAKRQITWFKHQPYEIASVEAGAKRAIHLFQRLARTASKVASA